MDLHKFSQQLQQDQFPLKWPGHWIGGAWVPAKAGGAKMSSFNPNTGSKLIDVYIDKESLHHTIDHAYKARTELAAMPLVQRLDILRRFGQALVDYQLQAELILRLEAGKPRWEAQQDIASAASYLNWVVDNGDDILKTLTAPCLMGVPQGGQVQLHAIGVTAAYLPFSTPITSFALYFAASMLAGCPLILNSSSHAMLSSLLIALLGQEQALIPGMLNVVFGNFSSFKQLLADKRIAAVLYTGSHEHCEVIRTESRQHPGRQLVLQSGGKNAVIVHSSANIQEAVQCVVYGALLSAGQRCTSTSRVFIYRSMLPAFREELLRALRGVKVGRTDLDAPGDPQGPFMGPLYSAKSVEKYLRFQTMANREGETLLWGKAAEGLGGGYFVTPSVHYVKTFDNTTAYQGNVLFSPNIAIYDYDVLDTAIHQINTTDAAFAVSFIGDPAVLDARRSLFLAPNLMSNTPTVEMQVTLPLAGRLQSGHHRYHGPGVALYLCFPQVLTQDSASERLIRSWPWPRY